MNLWQKIVEIFFTQLEFGHNVRIWTYFYLKIKLFY